MIYSPLMAYELSERSVQRLADFFAFQSHDSRSVLFILLRNMTTVDPLHQIPLGALLP
jgi:hypothetical protein